MVKLKMISKTEFHITANDVAVEMILDALRNTMIGTRLQQDYENERHEYPSRITVDNNFGNHTLWLCEHYYLITPYGQIIELIPTVDIIDEEDKTFIKLLAMKVLYGEKNLSVPYLYDDLMFTSISRAMQFRELYELPQYSTQVETAIHEEGDMDKIIAFEDKNSDPELSGALFVSKEMIKKFDLFAKIIQIDKEATKYLK